MTTFDLKSYARRGAEVRLAELHEEMNAIYTAFPDLRGGRQQPTNESAQGNGSVDRPVRRRRRRKMSAAERKAVSERMRRYWSERRNATAATKKK